AIDRLESSADDLKDAVEDGRDAAGELALMRSATQQIQDFLAKHALANAVGSTWGPLEAELSKIAYAW
ncbi:MAG: hypothetical protein ACRD3V_13485, partial [Vicinamibacteria bacterium]